MPDQQNWKELREELVEYVPEGASIRLTHPLDDAGAFVAAQQRLDSVMRAPIVLFDGRVHDHDRIADWVEACIAAEEATFEGSDPYDAFTIVILPRNAAAVRLRALLEGNNNLALVETDDATTDPIVLYQRAVYDSFDSMIPENPAEGLSAEPDPNARPIEEFIPENEREEWKARVRALQEEASEPLSDYLTPEKREALKRRAQEFMEREDEA